MDQPYLTWVAGDRVETLGSFQIVRVVAPNYATSTSPLMLGDPQSEVSNSVGDTR